MGSIERTSADDLLHLTYDQKPCTAQVGAILLLEPGKRLEVDVLRAAVADRVAGIPRLRQQLRHAPRGCGRPVWVDDPAFDLSRHITSARCPEPQDERALLDLAAALITTALPPDRPLWSATLVAFQHERCAIVIVLHHVIADGLGALTVLAGLVDRLAGAPTDAAPTDARPADAAPAGPIGPAGLAEAFPRQPPSPRQLFLDALASRMRGLLSGWRLPVLLYHASIELISGGRRTRKSSLNRPTGARRALALATADLARTRDAAHAAGGTVNDVILTAIAGALDAVLKDRGELVDRMTLSVMVSGRRTTTTPALGNSVGVMLATLPAPETHTETHTETRPETDVLSRIRHTADITRSRKARVRGASSVVITPLFRALSACHLATWFYNHQRRITTFVSNLRGPTSWLAICGCRIERIIPISATSGNVTVAFAVLSYAGTLAITTVADPDTCPDVERLAGYLQAELDLLTLGASPAPDAHQGHQQSSTISWRSPRSS